MFQSTFPQGERLQPHAVCPVRTLVSIHVPARGTTCRSPCFLVVFIVSIHVPARGTTSVAGSSGSVRMVSIHVPARGTTRRHGCCGYNNRVSIHVPARGTTRDAVSSVLPVKFQSTFPQGERLGSSKPLNNPYGFNPRSRKGNDERHQGAYCKRQCFNPRSRKGNDNSMLIYREQRYRVSIHVPARGTTPEPETMTFAPAFQSTFPQGERLNQSFQTFAYMLFQSTFPQGERQ